jgi:hypothetical protein
LTAHNFGLFAASLFAVELQAESPFVLFPLFNFSSFLTAFFCRIKATLIVLKGFSMMCVFGVECFTKPFL